MRKALVFTLFFVVALAVVENHSPESITHETDLFSNKYDIVLFINDGHTGLGPKLQSIENTLSAYLTINPKAGTAMNVIPFPQHPSRKLMFASTGSLASDIASSRDIRSTTQAAFNKLNKMGLKKILMVVGPMKTAHSTFQWAQGQYPQMTASLAALYTLYIPFQVREQLNDPEAKCELLGLFDYDEKLIPVIDAMGKGVAVMRDIGDTDPERMTALRIVEYLENKRAKWLAAGIEYKVEDPTQEKYPMCLAVNRATLRNPLHAGKIVTATYVNKNNNKVDQTLLLVGKGVTFDTGGANLKIEGNMLGMHNDKLGAASVAGFFEILSHLQPEGLKVIGYMPYIRNDLGVMAYLPDEIVTLRNGLRVRIGNTDAEGRNILTDVLILAKEQALNERNAHIFTIATLTGAASSSFGPYSVTMDNGPARVDRMAESLMAVGDLIADPSEVARIRIEDFNINSAANEYADIEQFKNGATGIRGFTFPAAYLEMVSKIDQHGLQSGSPIKYTHCDMAGSGGGIGVLATGAPLNMFATKFIVPRVITLK